MGKAKAPAFQFYPKDALADTEHLDSDSFKAYFRLNWYAWVGVAGCKQGTLPKKDAMLMALSGVGQEAWDRVRSDVLSLFIERETCYEHKRLAAEKRAQKRRKLQASRAGKIRWDKEKNAPSIPAASGQHGPTEYPASASASASALQDLDLDQHLKPSVPTERDAGSDPGSSLIVLPLPNGHVEKTPGQMAQALVGECCRIHAEAGVEVGKRDRGQWAGIAQRIAAERTWEQICFAVAGMDHGGGKLWRFSVENPDRVPWNLFHLEQFFTTAVAAGRVRLEGPQRAEDEFEERVRRRAENLR